MKIIGWDIGGAHIKAAKIDFKKKTSKTKQLYSPIWKNVNYLKKSIKLIKKKLGKTNYHAITMTAELSDIFPDRKNGVKHIINLSSKILGEKNIFFYSKKNFLKKKLAIKKPFELNSMNWHATASFVSNFFPNCILVDIGSTTSDIIPIKNKEIISKDVSDYQRLKSNELIYLGVLRTPIQAVERKKNLINENFANLSDVYRVLNKIPSTFDLLPTLDRKTKNKHDSARRIARIFGKDYKKNHFLKWKKIAYQIEGEHLKILKSVIKKIEKKNFLKKVPIIGAGIGEFLVKKIYNKKKYFSFYSTVNHIKKNKVINCESAISVAFILNGFLERKKSKL
jgi:probable H4MPT-linked C1 transfer pathway protein